MGILITGGAGFIGSHLAQALLHAGAQVSVLDDLSSGKPENLPRSSQLTLVEGDVADAELVAQLVQDASAVFHLAAIASVVICEQQPERATRTNVAGTQAVFDAVAAAQQTTGRFIPIVYASSAAVYGDNPNIPLRESETPAPINRYGQHKLENEHIAARAVAAGVGSSGMRFFNVYGPRQTPASPYSGVISKFMHFGQTVGALTIFGDGEQSRDFVYIRDVVDAMLAARRDCTQPAAPVFNVCSGQATNLKQLAAVIGDVLAAGPLPITYAEARTGDIRHSRGDARAINTLRGDAPWTTLADGLGEMLRVNA